MRASTVDKANSVFSRGERVKTIEDQHLEQLRTPHSLVDVAKDVLNLDAEEEEYIAKIPATMREGMRAAISHAIAEGKRLQFVFRPGGSDFVVTLWEYDEALVVHVEGPC
jgi:hypothetical protein